MTHYNNKLGKRINNISTEVKKFMLQYPWPGNVRELRNVVERIILLEDGDRLLPEHIAFVSDLKEEKDGRVIDISGGSLDYEEATKALIKKALKKAMGNVVNAARLLNIPVHKLRYRINKLNISD